MKHKIVMKEDGTESWVATLGDTLRFRGGTYDEALLGIIKSYSHNLGIEIVDEPAIRKFSTGSCSDARDVEWICCFATSKKYPYQSIKKGRDGYEELSVEVECTTKQWVEILEGTINKEADDAVWHKVVIEGSVESGDREEFRNKL